MLVYSLMPVFFRETMQPVPRATPMEPMFHMPPEDLDGSYYWSRNQGGIDKNIDESIYTGNIDLSAPSQFTDTLQPPRHSIAVPDEYQNYVNTQLDNRLDGFMDRMGVMFDEKFKAYKEDFSRLGPMATSSNWQQHGVSLPHFLCILSTYKLKLILLLVCRLNLLHRRMRLWSCQVHLVRNIWPRPLGKEKAHHPSTIRLHGPRYLERKNLKRTMSQILNISWTTTFSPSTPPFSICQHGSLSMIGGIECLDWRIVATMKLQLVQRNVYYLNIRLCCHLIE